MNSHVSLDINHPSHKKFAQDFLSLSRTKFLNNFILDNACFSSLRSDGDICHIKKPIYDDFLISEKDEILRSSDVKVSKNIFKSTRGYLKEFCSIVLESHSLDARAVLVVLNPIFIRDFSGKTTTSLTGLIERAEGDLQTLTQKAFENAFDLMTASALLGLSPFGSSIFISASDKHLSEMLILVFQELAHLGSGPFLLQDSFKNDEYLLQKKYAPLSDHHSIAFGKKHSYESLMETLISLTNNRFDFYKTNKNFLSSISLSILLQTKIDFLSENDHFDHRSRFRFLTEEAIKIQRASREFSIPEETLFQARLLSLFSQRNEPYKLVLWQESLQDISCPKGLYALGISERGTRCDQDSLGRVQLPAHLPYGAQTERSRINFDLGGQVMGSNTKFVRAMGLVKRCAALSNVKIGLMCPQKGRAIVAAALEVEAGLWDHAFPVDRVQAGGGIGMNMNINEVIAKRAEDLLGEPVHPNDDVNQCHATNDLVHTAMHLAIWDWLIAYELSLDQMTGVLEKIIEKNQSIVKLGRTCLMDALPMTIAQQFSGYLALVRRRKKALAPLKDACRQLPMGASGIGTGLGIAPGFLAAFLEILSSIKAIPFASSENFFDALQHADFYVDISAHLKAYATALSSFARDLRLMNSGPRAGFCEITLPAVQPGSSIMPGKINPLIPEQINQIAYFVCGNDAAITMAAEGADIDLNVWEAVFLEGITESFRMLCHGTHLFVTRCLEGIVFHEEKLQAKASHSLALATVISELYGYQKGVDIAKLAATKGVSVKEAVLSVGLMSEATASELLDPFLLTDREKYTQVLAIHRAGISKTEAPN